MRLNREQKRNEWFWSQAFCKGVRENVLRPLASKSATLPLDPLGAMMIILRSGDHMENIAAFIMSYTSANESRIRFDWNGKHADEFADRNMEFREAVREAVLADLPAVPLELIRDLFRAETQCSRESWCIVDGVGVLAERLLRCGGTDYLDDFLEGKFQSFDASLGSAFTVDLPLAEEMLTAVRARLRLCPDSPRTKLWRAGEKLFLDWIAGCQQEPG